MELEDGYVTFGECWDTEYKMRLTQLKGTHALTHITCLGMITTDFSQECVQLIRDKHRCDIVADDIMKPPSLQDALEVMSTYEDLERCDPEDQVWRNK